MHIYITIYIYIYIFTVPVFIYNMSNMSHIKSKNVCNVFLLNLINVISGSHQCRRCPIEFWSNLGHTACIPRKVDFLSFNETMGIVLTTAAVSGAVVTAAVFIVFLHYRHTPVVRALCNTTGIVCYSLSP